MRWLFAPATFITLLLAIPSRGASHMWIQNRPFDLPMTMLIAAIMLLAACLYLGWRKGRTLSGLFAAIVLAIVVSAAFFVAATAIGERAVWVAWLCGWLIVSVFQSMLDGHLELGRALLRGTVAAAVGAVGFALVVNVPVFPNFFAWLLAYAPGSTLLTRR